MTLTCLKFRWKTGPRINAGSGIHARVNVICTDRSRWLLSKLGASIRRFTVTQSERVKLQDYRVRVNVTVRILISVALIEFVSVPLALITEKSKTGN